jgi:hypothetical protein
MSIFPWGLLFKGLAILALVLFCWWAWDHYVKDPYVEQGRAEIQPKLDEALAANKSLAIDVTGLKVKVTEQNASIDQLTMSSIALGEARDAALAALAVREATLKTQIAQLRAEAAGPPSPTKEAACEKATSILHDLAAQRLRD